MSDEEARITCRTPNGKSDGTRIPAWKFETLRAAILDAIDAAGPEGILNRDLDAAVAARLNGEERERLGKLGWHVVTVKLELEVRGDIRRADGRGPLRFLRA